MINAHHKEGVNMNRVYPITCRSAYCSELSCPAKCIHLPSLNEFKDWVEKHEAIVRDEIWCSTVYTATKGVRNSES